MNINTVTFFSNYFNHHQKALCDAFFDILGEGFTFVETMPMEAFRAGMGWGEDAPSYLLRTYESEENEEKAKKLAAESDLVIMGTAPEYYIEPRLDAGKIIFRYSERPLKEGFIKFFIPRLTKKYIHLHVRNRNKNIHILGASAFTSLDYKKMFNSYPGKCYKFGYFPKHYEYDTDELLKLKKQSRELFINPAAGTEDNGKTASISILWEGRLLKLKRADLLVKAAAILKEKGLDFSVTIVGEGPEKEKLIKLSKKLKVDDRVCFEDFLKPDAAREKMSLADIYVMTSNFWEGWGSVIYEGLNAGCAVVASHACGATPWLVKDKETGLVFKSQSAKSLADKIECLLTNSELRERLSKNAYKQMHDLWNPSVAAQRTLELAKAIEENRECPYEDGPLSKAEFLKNNWYEG